MKRPCSAEVREPLMTSYPSRDSLTSSVEQRMTRFICQMIGHYWLMISALSKHWWSSSEWVTRKATLKMTMYVLQTDKWFESRSYIPRLDLIVWVKGVLRRNVGSNNRPSLSPEISKSMEECTSISAEPQESIATETNNQDASKYTCVNSRRNLFIAFW